MSPAVTKKPKIVENVEAFAKLYSPQEFLLPPPHEEFSLDEKLYYSMSSLPSTKSKSLSETAHDTEVLWHAQELIRSHKVVCFMGGHRRVKRGDPNFALCARVARRFAQQGYFILNGGGPGCMEASSLGAYFAFHEEQDLEVALNMLSEAPLFENQSLWQSKAVEVLEKFPWKSAETRPASLAIPTWVYGMEPSNVFSGHIGKCFNNALREDFLISNNSTDAILFFPGSFGTFEELFSSLSRLHYGFSHAKHIFVNREFWTEESGVYPLVQKWTQWKKEGPCCKPGMHAIVDTEEEIEDIFSI